MISYIEDLGFAYILNFVFPTYADIRSTYGNVDHKPFYTTKVLRHFHCYCDVCRGTCIPSSKFVVGAGRLSQDKGKKGEDERGAATLCLR